LAVAKTWREVARLLKVREQTLRDWRKRDDYPDELRELPIDTEQLWKWRQSRPMRLNRAAPDYREQRDAQAVDGLPSVEILGRLKKAEDLEIARLKRAQVAGELIPREDHVRAVVALASDFCRDLEELERSLPSETAGLSEAEARAIVQDRLDAVRAKYAGQRTLRLATDPELEAKGIDPATAKNPNRPGRPRSKP
jgi:hypothetical protein